MDFVQELKKSTWKNFKTFWDIIRTCISSNNGKAPTSTNFVRYFWNAWYGKIQIFDQKFSLCFGSFKIRIWIRAPTRQRLSNPQIFAMGFICPLQWCVVLNFYPHLSCSILFLNKRDLNFFDHFPRTLQREGKSFLESQIFNMGFIHWPQHRGLGFWCLWIFAFGWENLKSLLFKIEWNIPCRAKALIDMDKNPKPHHFMDI